MYRIIPGIALLAATALPVQAASYNAVHMTAASGTFTPHDTLNDTAFPINNWTNTQNPNANLVGGYVDLGAVAIFYGLPMHLYTSDGLSSPYTFSNMPPWGGPVPTATLDDAARTIQAELSALTLFWNVSNFGQGHALATGAWNPSTGIYHLAWDAPAPLGYGFDGLTGLWTMTGVAVVPEPETSAMLLAGLGLVAAAARRRMRPEAASVRRQ